jgi:hypothetical protein
MGGMGGMGGGMGGGMMGGMGGMGGGMGGMGMMGGGMRSVPATDLPFALLNPGQTRSLPTRLVSLSPPDPEVGAVRLPEKGEPLQLSDVADSSNSPQVKKALQRLAADMAPAPICQLVMWRLAAGLDWDTIARLSRNWANRHELTLAMDFVEHLDALPEGETGVLRLDVEGTDAASESMAAELKQALRLKLVLGMLAEVGIPASPEGPAVTCRVRLNASEALVQVDSSDATARNWVPFGKFTLPVVQQEGKLDTVAFGEALSEGILNRLVRAQLNKGVKDKGKMHYSIRIDNASPLILNGLAVLGTESMADETPKIVWGICVSPRRSLTVPASEEMVKTLGLKKGIKLVALNLSGL